MSPHFLSTDAMASSGVILEKQKHIFRKLKSMFLAVEALPPGPLDAVVLLQHDVLAERVPAAMTQCRKHLRFFEPLSEKEWRAKGLRLADHGPVDRAPDDAEFIATLAIAHSLQRALTSEATEDGASVFGVIGWHPVWYVLTLLSFGFSSSLHLPPALHSLSS